MKGGTNYMKESDFFYLTRIGNTTFIVNVKQSENAKKPLNTVFKDICRYEALGDFFMTNSFILEKNKKSS